MAARGSDRILDALEELVAELPGRVRGSRSRLSGQALGALRALADELGLVTRDEFDELELRVAQLEHRLRLLEQAGDPPPRLASAAEPLEGGGVSMHGRLEERLRVDDDVDADRGERELDEPRLERRLGERRRFRSR